MTFEPTRLESLGDSLDGEVKSVEILRGRLDALRSKADEKEKDEDGRRERERAVKHAEEVLDAYSAWLSDTSEEFSLGRPDAAEVRQAMPFRFQGRPLTRPRARCRTL